MYIITFSSFSCSLTISERISFKLEHLTIETTAMNKKALAFNLYILFYVWISLELREKSLGTVDLVHRTLCAFMKQSSPPSLHLKSYAGACCVIRWCEFSLETLVNREILLDAITHS